jgi:hypothetical protein
MIGDLDVFRVIEGAQNVHTLQKSTCQFLWRGCDRGILCTGVRFLRLFRVY